MTAFIQFSVSAISLSVKLKTVLIYRALVRQRPTTAGLLI